MSTRNKTFLPIFSPVRWGYNARGSSRVNYRDQRRARDAKSRYFMDGETCRDRRLTNCQTAVSGRRVDANVDEIQVNRPPRPRRFRRPTFFFYCTSASNARTWDQLSLFRSMNCRCLAEIWYSS